MHFLLLGALLFAVQHFRAGDPRKIVVTSGVELDLVRRFQDTQGRPPTKDEAAAELRRWKREEALYREARRLGLDRDDANVRSLLVGKMRSLAEAELATGEVPVPTEQQLEQWREDQRSRYETPLRYDFQFVEFSHEAETWQEELHRVEQVLSQDPEAKPLNKGIHGGNWTSKTLEARLPSTLARGMLKLTPREWTRLDDAETSWLVRLQGISGGLPSKQELRPQLVADWSLAQKEAAVERIVQRTVDLYEVRDVR